MQGALSNLEDYSIRTDLAREAHDMASQRESDESGIQGIENEEYEQDGIITSWIRIEEGNAADRLGKMPGTYLTLEVPGLRSKDSNLQKRVTAHFAQTFAQFLTECQIAPNASCLVVGLGNRNVTADALGPFVVKHLMVTRHLFELMPEQVEQGYRPVSAIAPGVLGTTGVETSEIIHGLVEKCKPDFIVAIDALASRALSRVYTTIQIADTGINPGSGVGNKRKGLTKETLGIPVIAIGIPTVVDAVTITHDTIDFILAHLQRQVSNEKPTNPLDPLNRATVRELQGMTVDETTRNNYLGLMGGLEENEKRALIHEVLSPLGQNLIVTPKEVDDFIGDMAQLIASGLNCALHEAVTMDNVAAHSH
ncbi:GPR endopeptidase [Mechercharimyces sp. CAU 1602]|nr:GPR endopeptidase [Mechercharimyces sp. CAU 1602]MCS1350438.1 GPR endopeptidase [Mechercharimyces sp. CAU 1602]